MLAAISSGSGNGDHYWLGELTKKISRITGDLRVVMSRIKRDNNPADSDVESALSLVQELVYLIDDQVMPRAAELEKLASGIKPPINLELRRLDTAGQEALSAIDIYSSTMNNENQQQGGRRSNSQIARDRRALQKERVNAAGKVLGLLEASEGLARFISR
jgi:hypothetical protein